VCTSFFQDLVFSSFIAYRDKKVVGVFVRFRAFSYHNENLD
jgi:hypothetical protein